MADNTKGYSDNGLRSLHAGIIRALAVDDATPQGKDKPFGVRVHSDWRRWGDALEAELKRRGLTFDQIGWDNGNA